MTGPITPARSILRGTPDHTLLRRVLKVQSRVDHIERIILVSTGQFRIMLRDTGTAPTPPATTASETALHLLWARDDGDAHVNIDGRETPIAPGDLVILPARTSWCASAGLILCEIQGGTADHGSVVGPTHGGDRFHGYNRETIYPPLTGMTISRWKISQPLVVPSALHDRIVLPLANPLTLLWPDGIDLVGPGDCRLLPAGSHPVTILPDGLGYALIVSVTASH